MDEIEALFYDINKSILQINLKDITSSPAIRPTRNFQKQDIFFEKDFYLVC